MLKNDQTDFKHQLKTIIGSFAHQCDVAKTFLYPEISDYKPNNKNTIVKHKKNIFLKTVIGAIKRVSNALKKFHTLHCDFYSLQ